MGQLEHFFPTAPRVLQQRRHNKQLGLSEDATARPSPASSSTSSSTKQQGTTSKSSAQAPSSSARANPNSASKDEVEKASRQTSAPSKSGSSTKHNHNRNHEPITTAPFDDSDATAGDILNGTGSASSTTTTDTVFSERLMHPHSSSSHHSQQQYHQHTMTSSTLTPLTNTESSPRTKLASPSFEQNYSAIESNSLYTNRGNITPQPTPPAASRRRSARPPDLEPKGTKCVYDPDFDRKTPRDKKKKAIHENFGDKPEHNVAPRDPRQEISGYRHGYSGKAKAKLRSAPYTFRHWHHESVPSSPAPLVNQPSAVVVTGFDPMTPLAQITALFSSFGEISDLDHKSDPVTGRFLGICVITYQDCPSFRGGGPVTAQLGAKTAFLEGKRGQRVGLKTVKIELDREGLSEKLVEAAISKHRRESGFTTVPRIAPPPPPPPVDRPPQPSGFAKVEGPPPTAPKGPGGKASARASVTSTAIPQNSLTLQNKAPEKKRERDERATGPHVIEDEPIAETLTNTPYIFIACEHVPVLISTIGHLKKRLRMYEWKDIRADKTGYFLVFDPSRAGQTEAKKTYHGAHMHPLFTYIMHMEVNINGVIQPAVAPAVQPTPGAATTPYDLLTQKQRFAAAREREYDMEVEKRQRAQDLDPCRAVVQLVVQELREKLIEDVKSRLAAPLLYDYLDPDRHVDKRRKLGIEDPSEAKRQSVADVFGIRRSGKASVSLLSLPKIGKKSTIERGTGFRDERRKALPPRPQVRSLFHQLSQFNDEEESDDEGKTTVTRDTEDVDSRPVSQMSMTSASSDDEQLIKKIQKRRLNHAREESEMGDVPLKEEPAAVRQNADDLIIQKLERNIAELSPSSRKRKRLIKELEARKRQKADDELFGVEKAEPDREVSVEPQIKEPETPVEATPEPEVVAKALKKPKPKKKTKKEIAAEKEALRLAQAEAEAAAIVEDVMEMADEEEALLEAAERRPEVEWGVSADHPQPTVEDDEDLVPDVRGWQASLVDDEDLKLLADVLKDKNATNIGSSVAWAWKQEQIRHQYRDVPAGAVRREPAIQGYYKPNPTGSARTEGVKKILESEKSQYLPHRLKVQRDRQRREAEANSATSGLTQVKAAPEVPKASSRGKRADDRRAVKDIDRQRELLREHGDDADVVGYNQLQKRKKPVKFDRSAIHNWGLYTKERIQASEMIIEYVGERVRQEISELREIRYTESGIGSSYLFRIDETTVIDATKKGGIARFINHSCSPNCTAKIIRVGNTRRIVIYALTDIPKDTELTYDYKFEREMDSENRIPCLCGSVNCKGFLN